MITARRATIEDAPELVRLRGVMLTGLNGRAPEPGQWQDASLRTLRRRLTNPEESLAAYVVDKPDVPGELAACVIGIIEYRLGGPSNPSGEIGYVFNAVTAPGYRRRGYFRACMEGLLSWYHQRGVTQVDLKASEDGEPLYHALGFVPTSSPAMRLTINKPATTPRG
ncbi:GNAT family N-acetyltransferase [Micromonospora arborensis]|uniref:GNAT family N-acetyltransferase n=1 Tax=Micromonospora arborensis TaxID=2116518 RepID=UPI0033C9E61A